MRRNDWMAVVVIILLTNAGTLFLTKKFLVPEIKVCDLVQIVEKERRDDIEKVLNQQMTQEQFVNKHSNIGIKIDAAVAEENGIVLVKQSVMGDKYEDITKKIQSAISK